jgi:hypothetical protein
VDDVDLILIQVSKPLGRKEGEIAERSVFVSKLKPSYPTRIPGVKRTDAIGTENKNQQILDTAGRTSGHRAIQSPWESSSRHSADCPQMPVFLP